MRPTTTIFLKEDNSQLNNLMGEECSESGYVLDKEEHRLITSYSNCLIHKERHLGDVELKQWMRDDPDKQKNGVEQLR